MKEPWENAAVRTENKTKSLKLKLTKSSCLNKYFIMHFINQAGASKIGLVNRNIQSLFLRICTISRNTYFEEQLLLETKCTKLFKLYHV